MMTMGKPLATAKVATTWVQDNPVKKIVSFRQQCMIVPENHALLPKAYDAPRCPRRRRFTFHTNACASEIASDELSQ
jgi:hypothetical protein